MQSGMRSLQRRMGVCRGRRARSLSARRHGQLRTPKDRADLVDHDLRAAAQPVHLVVLQPAGGVEVGKPGGPLCGDGEQHPVIGWQARMANSAVRLVLQAPGPCSRTL
jgi:hypothetical protein